MAIRALLYDAARIDREVTLEPRLLSSLGASQLLWVDVTGGDPDEIRQVAGLLNLTSETLYSLLQPSHRPRLDNYGEYIQFNVESVEEGAAGYRVIDIQFVVRQNLVLTSHPEPAQFLESFHERVRADTDLGQLDAAALVAGLLDWHITGYFRILERLEAAVDRIDAHALRPYHTRDLLTDLSRLRHEVAYVRRRLTPHREVYGALLRPDTRVTSSTGTHGAMVGLHDRLERAIEAAENARELLVGSFEIFTTQTTLRTNEAIKVLTLISAMLLPATFLVSAAYLLLRTPVYGLGPGAFWILVALILIIGALTLLVARVRRWI